MSGTSKTYLKKISAEHKQNKNSLHGSITRKTKLSILNSIAKKFSSKNFTKKVKYTHPLVEGQYAIDFMHSITFSNPLPPTIVWTASTKLKDSEEGGKAMSPLLYTIAVLSIYIGMIVILFRS